MKNLNIKLALLLFALIIIISAGIPYLNNQNEVGSENQNPGIKTIPGNENPIRINETENQTKNNSSKNSNKSNETGKLEIPDNEDPIKTNETEEEKTEIERKHAIWVYANNQEYTKKAIEKINQIDFALPRDEKIKYIFLSSAAIEIRNNSNSQYATAYTYDSVNLTRFKEEFPEMEIQTMVEASKQTSENLEHANKTWIKEMASDLNKDIENNSENIDGVHFDIEPYTKKVGELIDEFEKQSKLPTSVAFGSNYEDLDSNPASKTDLAVLMNYAQGANSMDNFRNAFERRSNYFFTQCQEQNQKCMNGILISETSTEKENIHEYTKVSLEEHQNFKDQSEGIAMFAINYRTGKIPKNKTMQTLAENI